MAGSDAIRAEGLVVEAMSDSAFRVELPNGHKLVARLPRRLAERRAEVTIGARVTVEMSPYDMSSGRIVMNS